METGQSEDPRQFLIGDLFSGGRRGMAVAIIDHGSVVYVQSYGIRNVNGDPLTIDTVMYGASLTKTVVAYAVMQLVDQGKLKLDTPIEADLDQPLPSCGPDPVFPDAAALRETAAHRKAAPTDSRPRALASRRTSS